MTIGVTNQYYFQFSIPRQDDFIFEGNLEKFLIVEYAGTALPKFEMQFICADENILRYLNEGNSITAIYGLSAEYATGKSLVITRKVVRRIAINQRRVYLEGFLDQLPYIANTKVAIYGGSDGEDEDTIPAGPTGPLSGVEVLASVVGNYFDVTPDGFAVQQSLDRQIWVQPNITDRQFATELWLHSYLPGTFLLAAITVDGRFLLKDATQLVMQDPDWEFSLAGSNEEKTIIIDPGYKIEDQSTWINMWVGRSKEVPVYNLEDGGFSYVVEEPLVLQALSDTIARSSKILPFVSEVAMTNGNVDPNYWSAYWNNLTNLAVYSSLKTRLSFRGVYKDIHVLDLAIFKETSVEDNIESEAFSGLYIVSKVALKLVGRQLVTTVELSREAVNQSEGDFR